MPSPRPVVLVTGASRGLGLSICKTLLDGSSTLSPANVISLSRTLTADLRALSSRPPKDGPHGATLHAIQGDVCEPAANQAAVNAALDHFGRLDALILNAGTISFEKISEMDPASFAHILQVNTVSLLTTIQAALPHLRSAKHGGKVVFVSSGAATGGTAGWAAYNASKAALNSLCRTLANEEPTIACWAVRPGVVDTEMQNQIRTSGLSSMTPTEHSRFTTLHAQSQLVPAYKPAHVLAALAVRGSRDEPKEKGTGKGIGGLGGFVDWAGEELAEYRVE